MGERAHQLLHHLGQIQQGDDDNGIDHLSWGGKFAFAAGTLGPLAYSPTMFGRVIEKRRIRREILATKAFREHPTKKDHYIYKEDGSVFKIDLSPRRISDWGLKHVQGQESRGEVRVTRAENILNTIITANQILPEDFIPGTNDALAIGAGAGGLALGGYTLDKILHRRSLRKLGYVDHPSDPNIMTHARTGRSYHLGYGKPHD